MLLEIVSRIHEWRCKNKTAYVDVLPENTVHDSVEFEIADNILPAAIKHLKKIFELEDWGWPIRIEVKVGKTAGKMKAYAI